MYSLQNYLHDPFQGAIVVGNDADFAVWEPEMEFVLDDNYKTYHKHPVCVIFPMYISTSKSASP